MAKLRFLLITTISLFGVFAAPATMLAETERFPAHFTPPPLDPQLRNSFFDAFIAEEPLSIGREGPEPKLSDEKLRDVWLGNRPKLESAINEIVLTFESSASVEKESYDIFLTFRDDGRGATELVVRSSRPATPLLAGGVIVHLTGPRIRRTVLRGQKGASVVVALPMTVGDGMRGLLLCPMMLSGARVDTRTGSLVDPGFRPVAARLSFQGRAEGSLLSGVSLGGARANIATSKGIPNERLHYDETFTKDPRIEVSYQGDPLSDVIPIPAGGKLLQGAQLKLELETPAGYVRTTTLTELLEVAPVDRDFSFSFASSGGRYEVNGRSCYSILQTWKVVNEYERGKVG